MSERALAREFRSRQRGGGWQGKRAITSTPAVLILLQPKEARLITFRVESKD